MSKKRFLSDAEKIEVQKIQRSGDGALRCYISGKIIDLENNAIDIIHRKTFYHIFLQNPCCPYSKVCCFS